MSVSMNILILSWRGPKHPNAGGAEIVTFEHAKAWAKAGDKVTLFTSQHTGLDADETIDGVRIIRRGDAQFGVRLQAFLWYLFSPHGTFDLVVDEFHGIPFFTPIYVRAKKLGFIHEVAKEVWFLNFIYPKAILGYIFEPWIFRLIYRNTPFMTVSESTKNDLENWGINKKDIYVIYNGINIPKTSRVYTASRHKEEVVTFLGVLNTDKGIEDAIQAFSYIAAKNSKVKMWIIGKGSKEYIERLKKKLAGLKIAKRVKFWGFVSEKKKYELLAKSHLILNPSIREGWGLVVIEGNAVGTPTVGYRVPGLIDSIQHGETGILVKRGDVLQMANEALRLFNDQKLYKKFSENALRWSKKFRWNLSTKESLRLVHELV